jgi:hypothetical protein
MLESNLDSPLSLIRKKEQELARRIRTAEREKKRPASFCLEIIRCCSASYCYNYIRDKCEKFIDNKAQYPIEVTAALYNYKFVKEDGSKGIHNTKYAVQLLMDSIKTLDKNFDDSKRPE